MPLAIVYVQRLEDGRYEATIPALAEYSGTGTSEIQARNDLARKVFRAALR